MERKEINILRKIVHQVGFIYKIVAGRSCISIATKESYCLLSHSKVMELDCLVRGKKCIWEGSYKIVLSLFQEE
jgi:hypothetical protein